MARARSKATARARLNLEIVGIAAIGLAVLCGVSLAIPHLAGSFGGWTADALRRLFGAVAPLFPVLVALFGAIVFLEVNVPRMIAGWGSAALAYFLMLDAAFGAAGPVRGGAIGSNIWWALHALVGPVGAWIVLAVCAISLTLWLTNASLKRLIGRAIQLSSAVRLPKMPALPKLRLPEGHTSVRDAFALPKSDARPNRKTAFDAQTAAVEPEVERTPPVFTTEALLPVVPAMPPIEEEPEIDDAPVTGEYESADSVSAVRAYRLPDLSLFDPPPAQVVDDSNRAHVLEDTLASFGVGAKVMHIERGPSITRYELKPERGVKISR
ncbi:MAG TPA: DNA translocase FtsK 4TM domain-containing protein, partial [Candidatus Baltobacteraceae bacterium]|nr:DNA translocase FtsK 4TM domain-containing protein [Candidatus Baltobacteraceae bacterium]